MKSLTARGCRRSFHEIPQNGSNMSIPDGHDHMAVIQLSDATHNGTDGVFESEFAKELPVLLRMNRSSQEAHLQPGKPGFDFIYSIEYSLLAENLYEGHLDDTEAKKAMDEICTFIRKRLLS